MRPHFNTLLLSIVAFVAMGCDNNRNEFDVDLLIDVFSGEHLASSKLQFLDYSFCQNPSATAQITATWDMERHDTGSPYTEALPLYKDDFWDDIEYDEDKIRSVLREYHRVTTNSLHKERKEACCLLAMFEGGIQITSEQEVFGRTPGENLSDCFRVCLPGAQLTTMDFLVSRNGLECSTEAFFQEGNFLTAFTLYTTEPITETTTFSISIPVRKLLYLSYIRDRLYRPETAKLEIIPEFLTGTVVVSLQ